MSHPPRPRLVLRIGVTGHRLAALQSAGFDETKLRETICHALFRVAELTREIHTKSRLGYSEEAPLFRVISPLAEGADRLVAEEGRKLGYDLLTPLPFPPEEYRKDFNGEASQDAFDRLLGESQAVFELHGSRSAANQAYEEAGRVVLRQCDVLIAVWDGMDEEGRGGTGQVVREAVASEIPILWIRPKPPHEISVYQRPELDLDKALEVSLRGILALPEGRELKGLQRFLDEGRPRFRAALWFRLFCKTFAWDWPLPKLRITEFDESDPFDWADVVADLCADRYRSSFLGTYLLGAIAVLMAFLGAQVESIPEGFRLFEDAHGWFWAELFAIVVILLLVVLNKWRHWHERWIDYRLLAEGLRLMKVLGPLARVTPNFDVPPHLSEHDPRSAWFNWYFRAHVRQALVPAAKVHAEYLESCRQILSQQLDGQIRYHGKNEQRLDALRHRLHGLSTALFSLTLIACLLHLDLLGKSQELFGFHADWLLALLAIVLPAFGASIQGIVHQGEFGRLARRSRALKNSLVTLQTELSKQTQPLSFRRLSEAAEDFSWLQLQEQTDWRSVFVTKVVAPP